MAGTAPLSLWELVEARAHESPTALMLIDEADRSIDFATFRDEAEEVAAGLLARGVRPGTAIAWIMPTWIETFVVMAALARLGTIQVPLLPQFGPREIQHALETTGATAVIAVDDFRGVAVADNARRSAETTAAVVIELAGRELPRGSDHLAPVASEPARVSWIVFTSGSTAAPKGVLHTDETLRAAAAALVHSSRLGSGDVGSVAFPVAHVGGPVALIMSLLTGTPNVVIERFTAPVAVDVFRRNGVTLLGAGPGFQPAYLALQQERPDEALFPTLRAFLSGGAPKIRGVHDALRSATGVEILSSYGMTEFPTATGHTPDDPIEKLAMTEGRPNPGVEIDIRDSAEIWLRGPQLCVGYLDPDATAAAFDDDGWFCTGDLGFVDPDGYLVVSGRAKEVVIRKGENISIAELEDLLSSDPSVREVAVVGMPDAVVGERCCAVVVPTDSHDLPTLAQLNERLLDAGIMRQKLPEQLDLVTSLPRNANGKVQRAVIIDELEGRSRLAGEGSPGD